jgi:hypothetical protein
MAETLTAEEVKAKSVAAMSETLGKLHYELHNQIAWLHLKWKDFRALYAATPETIDLLNEAAPEFFHNLQRTMWEDVLLHLCRITDLPKSGGKNTLTIRRIAEIIPDPQLRKKVASQVKDVIQKIKFARDWRNRRLAHRELPPLDGHVPQPLADASRKHVEDALAAIRETMNIIERHYLNSAIAYEHSIEALGGVDALLSRLKTGVAACRAELERFRGK